MDRATYRALLETVTLPLSAWPHFAAIARMYGVSVDTVFSIYSLEVQTRVLRTNHVVKAAIGKHAQRYLAGTDAVQLAFELGFPPCVLMRRLLEALQLGLAKERITRVLRSPDQLSLLVSPDALAALAASAAASEAGEAAAAGDAARRAVAGISGSGGGSKAAPAAAAAAAGSGGGASTQQLLLERLQRDVEECVLCDRVYSPESDMARHNAGNEYEERLNADLAAAGVAFWTEDQLRFKGYHKTPDARLQVPIAVQGRIVNWIDSKATFGDDKLHRQQTAEQYERYVNRFGPGLVIYWHGYLADLSKDGSILLMNRFPRADEIVQLPCLPLRLVPLPAAASTLTVGATAAAAGEAIALRDPAAEGEEAQGAAAVQNAGAAAGGDAGAAAAGEAGGAAAAAEAEARATGGQGRLTLASPAAGGARSQCTTVLHAAPLLQSCFVEAMPERQR